MRPSAAKLKDEKYLFLTGERLSTIMGRVLAFETEGGDQ